MQTNFTAAQLRDPRIAEADAILRTCVHYGFCTNTCPTYVLTRDENESPRGRIDLIRVMLEKGGAPDAKTVAHLDSCLSCLSCMTTCAVKVDYVHLIDRARAHIERHFRRPLLERVVRALLAHTLPYPSRFRAAMMLGRLARPLRPLLPQQLRTMLDMIPPRVAPDVLAPQVFRAEGAVRKRVALLAGCAQQALNGDINAATIRLLLRHGCEVVKLRQWSSPCVVEELKKAGQLQFFGHHATLTERQVVARSELSVSSRLRPVLSCCFQFCS
jgi:glycolate oxidase iron-sulfur subunit